MPSSDTNIDGRFHDQEIVFANGSRGMDIEIPSASPVNYYQVLNASQDMPEVTLDGKLFLPVETSQPVPLVMLIPGSLGVAPSHVAHAETLNAAGIATFVLDCFGARSVTLRSPIRRSFLLRRALTMFWRPTRPLLECLK